MAPEPYLAAVVQPTVRGVVDDASARATIDANARQVASWVDAICSLVSPAPRLFVFPALCLTGGSRHARGVHADAVAMELPSSALEPVLAACARNDCYVASSAHERLTRFPGHLFHTGFILGPAGVVLRSPKAQAYSAPEVTVLRDFYRTYVDVYGVEAVLPVAHTPIGALGCLVESELQVPEAARLLRRKGADLIVHPTLERPEQQVPWASLKQSIAYAAGVYVVSASAAGEVAALPSGPHQALFLGSSAIIGPDGTLLGSVARGEGFAVALIDVQHLTPVRDRQARYTDPADVLYGTLYSPSPL